MKDWEKINSEQVADLKLFKARFDYYINPRNQSKVKATVLESQDSTNILGIDKSGQILFIKQFRFGVEDFCIELPGGLIEEAEVPLLAAQRELREETGYVSQHWEYLGLIDSNPVYMDSKVHHFVAYDLELKHELQLDKEEDIEILFYSPEEMIESVKNGTIRHPHTISALTRVYDVFGVLNS